MNVAGEIQVQSRWLVLGATGFVGRAVLRELQSRQRVVLGVGHAMPQATAKSKPPTVDILATDPLRTLLRGWQPNILLNATGHPEALPGSGLEEFYVRSTKTLLAAVAAEVPAGRMLLLGSAAEYGNSPAGAGSAETDPLKPLSNYGRAKCEQGRIAAQFAPAEVTVVTARLFNPVGPGQSARQLPGALRARILQGERPLRVAEGRQVRDWVDIRDVARALVTLGETTHPPRVVNICTGQGHTVARLAETMGRLAGVPVIISPGEVSPDILWHSLGQAGCLRALGWQPQYSLTESLAELLR